MTYGMSVRRLPGDGRADELHVAIVTDSDPGSAQQPPPTPVTAGGGVTKMPRGPAG